MCVKEITSDADETYFYLQFKRRKSKATGKPVTSMSQQRQFIKPKFFSFLGGIFHVLFCIFVIPCKSCDTDLIFAYE